MRTIEIDFDVHKAIELERKSFEDTPNAALRRLLGLEAAEAATPTQCGWRGEGVFLPSGTKLRMRYSGNTYAGEIVGAAWRIGGVDYHSPSGAASAVARTRAGKRTRLNGWTYWEVQVPDSDLWRPIMELYREAGGVEGVTLEDLNL